MQIKLKLNLIDKTQIKEESYKKQDGTVQTDKVIMLEFKNLREEKIIATSKNGEKQLVKTGFIALPDTKNPDNTYTKGEIIGDVQEWREINKVETPSSRETNDTGEAEAGDIPF